jgi:hypothetical protein
LVRSLRDHFKDSYHKQGDEFDYSGELYEHIEPADPAEAAKAAKAAAAAEDKKKAEPEHAEKPAAVPDNHGKK